MPIDWFVVLTPLVLLMVALPLLFVGCTIFTTVPQEPAKPAPPDPAPPTPGTPPPAPVQPKTFFRLDMDANLQENAASPVVRIGVRWELRGNAPTLQVSTGIGAIQDPPPPIDPVNDQGAKGEILTERIGQLTGVRCICTVELADHTEPPVIGENNNEITLVPNMSHDFRIERRRGQQQVYRVYRFGA